MDYFDKKRWHQTRRPHKSTEQWISLASVTTLLSHKAPINTNWHMTSVQQFMVWRADAHRLTSARTLNDVSTYVLSNTYFSSLGRSFPVWFEIRYPVLKDEADKTIWYDTRGWVLHMPHTMSYTSSQRDYTRIIIESEISIRQFSGFTTKYLPLV